MTGYVKSGPGAPVRHSPREKTYYLMSDFSSSGKLVLLPAVDVADGKAVRLTQGEAGTETSYGDPVDAAEEWMRQGLGASRRAQTETHRGTKESSEEAL